MKQTIEINLPSDIALSALVRNMADDVFRAAHFSEAWCSRLKLVVDELFMNAVRYGSTPLTSLVKIRFVFGDESVEFLIDDDGTGSGAMSPEALQALIVKKGDHQEVTQTSGRGLALITHLWTDELHVAKSALGGLTVSFIKKLETAPPPLLPPLSLAPSPLGSSLPVQAPGPTVTLHLQGSMDPNTIEDVSAQVEKQIETLPAEANLVLDFSEVTYINSTFIGQLAVWYNVISKKRGVLSIQKANSLVKDVLNLVGLSQIIIVQ